MKLTIIILLILTILLTGCYKNDYLVCNSTLDTAINNLNSITTELQKSEVNEAKLTFKVQDLEANINACNTTTTITEEIFIPTNASCNSTFNSTYLTFEEYMSMSIRIKALERRLDLTNATDLYENYTRCVSEYDICNATLSEIVEVLE